MQNFEKYLLFQVLFVFTWCLLKTSAGKSSLSQLPLNTVRLSETTSILASSTPDTGKKYSDFNSIYRMIALVGKSVTLSCAIEFDPASVVKGHEYKLLWSRESNDSSDYDPLFLDETRLSSDARMTSSRVAISKPTHDRIQWSLVIDKLRLEDSRNYICQLNVEPYDTHWLKRYLLVVNEPAYFEDDEESLSNLEKISEYDQTVNYIKHVREHEDLKLKCVPRGKPKPFILWSFKFLNGTVIYREDNSTEVLFTKVKRDLRLERIECQIGNGFGPVLTRNFKINIKFLPYIVTKSRTIRVPVRANEFKLNCSSIGNPLNRIVWYFKKHEPAEPRPPSVNETLVPKTRLKSRLHHRHVIVGHNKLNEKAKHASHKQSKKKSQEAFDELPKSTTTQIDVDSEAFTRAPSTTTTAIRPPEWINLNSIGYYAPYEKSNISAGMRLALSKYQIYEKVFPNNQISSILIVRSVNENDFGVYKCFASNELGNKSIEIKAEELNYQTMKPAANRTMPIPSPFDGTTKSCGKPGCNEYAYDLASTKTSAWETTSGGDTASTGESTESTAQPDELVDFVDEDIDLGDAFNTKRNSHELFLLSGNSSVVVLNDSSTGIRFRTSLNSLLVAFFVFIIYF